MNPGDDGSFIPEKRVSSNDWILNRKTRSLECLVTQILESSQSRSKIELYLSLRVGLSRFSLVIRVGSVLPLLFVLSKHSCVRPFSWFLSKIRSCRQHCSRVDTIVYGLLFDQRRRDFGSSTPPGKRGLQMFLFPFFFSFIRTFSLLRRRCWNRMGRKWVPSFGHHGVHVVVLAVFLFLLFWYFLTPFTTFTLFVVWDRI